MILEAAGGDETRAPLLFSLIDEALADMTDEEAAELIADESEHEERGASDAGNGQDAGEHGELDDGGSDEDNES